MPDSLEFPFGSIPAPEAPIEIATGLLWLRLPLPFALNHVNLWLLDDDDGGWSLIDTGIGTDALKAIWSGLLEGGALNGFRLNRIIVTHFHPDHMGLAGWLCSRFEAPLFTSRTDWMKARILSSDDSDRVVASALGFYQALGVDAEALVGIANRGNLYARRVSPVPRQFERLADGEHFRMGGTDWRVLATPGHAPEMLCFHSPERNILIAADHILPEISPNVSVWPDEPNANPLADFLCSLAYIRQQVPDDCLVLPSHGRPFHGLHARIDWLAAHHQQRLEQMLDICRQPVTGLEAMSAMFERKLDPHQWGFAMGEALAHLHLLMADGRIIRERDAAGLYRYQSR